MAISRIGSNKASATTGTAVSVSAPANIKSGDLVLFIIHGNNNITISDNNGSTPAIQKRTLQWNNIPPLSATSDIWYRVAGSAEPSTYNFTLSATNRWSIIVAVYRGVHSDIWDVAPSASTENAATSTTPTTLTLTTRNDGALSLAVEFVDSNTTTNSAFPADSYNQIQDITDQRAAASDKVQGVVGTQIAVTWTINVSTAWLTSHFSLKPALPIMLNNYQSVGADDGMSVSERVK